MLSAIKALETIDDVITSNNLSASAARTGIPSKDRFIPELNLAICLPAISASIDNWPHDRLLTANRIRAYRTVGIDWIIIPLDAMRDESTLYEFMQDEIRLRTEPIGITPVYSHDKTRRNELGVRNAISLYTTVDDRWFTTGQEMVEVL